MLCPFEKDLFCTDFLGMFPTLVFTLVLLYYFLAYFLKVFRIKHQLFTEEGKEFVFVILMYLVAFLTYQVLSAFVGEDVNEKAISFLSHLLREEVMKSIGLIYTTDIINAFFKHPFEVPMSKFAGVWYLEFTLIPEAGLFANANNVIKFFLYGLFLVLSLQIVVLSLIKAVVPFLYGLGLLLWLIPQTRNAGVFFVSLSIAFILFFPYIYIVEEEAYEQLQTDPDYNSKFGYLSFYAYTALAKVLVPYTTRWATITLGTRGASGLSIFLVIPYIVLFIFDMLGPGYLFYHWIIYFLIARTVVTAFIIPALNIVLTVTFLNSLQRYLLGVS